MNWLSKMERKYGRYAIHNLMYYIIILYGLGFLIQLFNPTFYSMYLSLDAKAILSGQVWRLVTFIINPPSTSPIFVVFALYLYYMIGTNLERQWGAFSFNLYFFTGVLGHIAAAFILFFLTGISYHIDTNYLNMSLFFAFAATYPDMQLLLFFVIPIKIKYLALLNGVLFILEIINGSMAGRISAILSLANFLVFFAMTRNLKRVSPSELKRKAAYRQQVNRASGITRHKCAICGRTEKDGENLEFRFCSKCDGNYEYCSEHLYTHQHIKKQ